MATDTVPYEPLPEVVLLARVERKKIGTYMEQDYDAYLDLDGLRWFRVKDGFGKRGDREDWVLSVEVVGQSVSRWFSGETGWEHGKFPPTDEGRRDAMRACVAMTARYLRYSLRKQEERATALREAVETLLLAGWPE